MKAIHFLLGLVLYLSIAAVGLALIVSPEYPDFIQMALAWGGGMPAWGRVACGVGGIFFLFAFLLTGFSWRGRRAFVTFANENGTVSISAEALQEYVDRLKDEFAAVAWMKTGLQVRRGALSVGLVLGVKESTRIPELCKLIQERVREILEEHLGTCDLGGISIEVDEIQARKKTVGDAGAA